jgi:hypothetical protein
MELSEMGADALGHGRMLGQQPLDAGRTVPFEPVQGLHQEVFETVVAWHRG